MISTIKVLESASDNPYANIALEKFLAMHAEEGECILFLWQNAKTVVIGKNQNALEECRLGRLKHDGGFLARRLSGGGAVFHDQGNLNFSFLVRKPDYNVQRQTKVILAALLKLGIPAKVSGRNDLTIDGRKFSGHAYYEKSGFCCHHGTLMMDMDEEDLEKYLSVSPEKLHSNGVHSIRRRTVSLRKYCPGICREILVEKLTAAFSEEYGLECLPFDQERLDAEEIQREASFLTSDKWLFGRRMHLDAQFEKRFSWGSCRLQFSVNNGLVTDVICTTDALDEDFPSELSRILPGCPFDAASLTGRLLSLPDNGSVLRQTIQCSLAELIRSELE